VFSTTTSSTRTRRPAGQRVRHTCPEPIRVDTGVGLLTVISSPRRRGDRPGRALDLAYPS
jgi:hypothetical protein